jgi:hypothetical protein
MLETIVSMYWNAPMATKLNGPVGWPFDSTRGVKQGDPLSPLLFGLFFDRIEKWMGQRARSCGVELGGQLVRMLLYADDLALIAQSAAHLQLMLNALHAFCVEYDMDVNVDKTEIVVFGSSCFVPSSSSSWRYGASTNYKAVKQSQEFKYLGITFHETKGVSVSVDALYTAGHRAMWAMLSRCSEHNISSMSMKVHLFNTLVTPILCYCSEVWGVALMYSEAQGDRLWSNVLNNHLCQLQMLGLRMIAGKPGRSVPRHLLLRKLGCRPLVWSWFRGMSGMWNRITSMQPTELLARAMRENIQLSEGNEGAVRYRKQLWFYRFKGILQYVHRHTQQLTDVLQQCSQMQPLRFSLALQTFEKWLYQQWHDLPSDPRTAPSHQVVYCTYDRWFAEVPLTELDLSQPSTWCPPFVHKTAGLCMDHEYSLLRFRLGAHDLRVATGRWGQARASRGARLCDRCDLGLVEDEFHMVFECPFYAPVRERFAVLFLEYSHNWEHVAEHVRSDGLELKRFVQQDV